MHDPLGKQRKFVDESAAERMSNGRAEGGRRAVDRHFTDTLRLVWPGIGMRKLDEFHVNVRRIRAGGNNVVRVLIVLHRSLFQNDVLIKRKTNTLGNAAFDLP